MVYATIEQVEALAHPDAQLPGDGEDFEALIVQASHDVDLVLGRRGVAYVAAATLTETLTVGEATALGRAVTRACEHRCELDLEETIGGTAYTPAGLSVARGFTLPPSPAVERELAGSGLLLRRLVAPSPPDPVV